MPVKDGRIEQSNFDTYNSMRIAEMPKVESIVMPTRRLLGRHRRADHLRRGAGGAQRLFCGDQQTYPFGAAEESKYQPSPDSPGHHPMTSNRYSAPFVAVEAAVNSRSVLRETDRAALLVAAPDLPQRRKLRAFQRRLRSGGAKNNADIVGAGAIDGIPERADLVRRHPVLRVQQDDGIDLACRKAFQKLPEIGMDRDNQSRTVAHPFKLAALQIRRQAAIAGTGVAAMQRLPCKIIGVVGMSVDQAQQPLMKHFVERRVCPEQGTLLGRNAEAEQQAPELR